MENDKKVVTFKEGRVSRNELELPTLHFVVMDQWIDVIGERALMAWLKMYSWCKRDEVTEVNQWEQAKIPTSFNQIIKKLGVGRTTFYKNILQPLWNVGLIDIEEFANSENKGHKPMNVIVYKYPQNNKALAHQEIKEIRNYDKDYQSEARTFAKRGGRKRKQEGGTEPVQGVVLDEYKGVYQTSTGGGTEIVHNNILNTNNNSLNNINNKITTTKDNDVAEISVFFDENGFGLGNSFGKQSLLSYLDDDDFEYPKEMIIEAMGIACNSNIREVRYVEGILKNWIKKGIKGLADLQGQNKQEQEKDSGRLTYGSIPKTEMTDEEKAYWEKIDEEINASLPDYIT